MKPSLFIIAIGKPLRGDDGVGPALAQQLRGEAGVQVHVESEGGVALMDLWRGAQAVILIGTVESGSALGTIHQFDAQMRRIPAHFFCSSTHDFSVGEVVELARALHRLPRRLIVFGIEGRNFEIGAAISTEVADAAAEMLEYIREEIEQLAGRERQVIHRFSAAASSRHRDW